MRRSFKSERHTQPPSSKTTFALQEDGVNAVVNVYRYGMSIPILLVLHDACDDLHALRICRVAFDRVRAAFPQEDSGMVVYDRRNVDGAPVRAVPMSLLQREGEGRLDSEAIAVLMPRLRGRSLDSLALQIHPAQDGRPRTRELASDVATANLWLWGMAHGTVQIPAGQAMAAFNLRHPEAQCL